MAVKRIQVAALTARLPNTVGPDGAPSSWSQAWCTESPAAAAKTNTRNKARLSMAPGMFRGKVSRVLIVNVYTSWLCKVY